MFRRVTLITTSLFCLFAIFWVFQFCTFRQSDLERYKAFIEKQELAMSAKSSLAVDQKRLGVQKDIWFTQEDLSRLHYRIESEASTLTLIPIAHKLEIVENLEKIRCSMQDKLYASEQNPMQQVRYLLADQGIYRYATQQFIADSVTVSLFRIPGQTLPSQFDEKTAFLRGIAQNISFAVAGKNPQFQAQNFKAFLRKDGS